jgi:hypothetical protein
MPHARFIADALEQPGQVLFYRVSSRLAELYPESAVLEGNDCDFDLLAYVREGLCTVRAREEVHAQVAVWWSEGAIRENPKNVWYEVDWRGQALEVLLIDTPDTMTYHWIIGPDEKTARAFYQAVCAYDPDYSGEVLVFEAGRFAASAGLYRAAAGVRLEDLVQVDGLKERIRADVERFLASRAAYEAIGAPWKRGILLTGPPGNGKTHTIKALVGELKRPCLYVKSFKSERWTEETAIQRIFQRARTLAPCLVVLEDLDALVTDDNRSFLLNELDGFAQNTGMIVLATTNHPEKLDPALVERPSRFDRRYHFPLPGPIERATFLARWREKLPEGQRPSAEAMDLAVEATEGFSFAFLKELQLSVVLGLAASDYPGADEALLEQATMLREQIRSRPRG